MRAPMHRLAPLAVLALTASTAAALPTDDGNTRPTPPPRTGAPEDLRRREVTNIDAYANRNHGHQRGGFAAFDAGLTLASDDATTNQAATGLGFTLGAYISRGLVFAGRGSFTLDTDGSRGRPFLRDVGVAFGVDVRVWRPLWAGAGLGFTKHRFDDPGMATATPTARLRLGVDAYRLGDATLFVTADWVADIGADASSRLTTIGAGLRYR